MPRVSSVLRSIYLTWIRAKPRPCSKSTDTTLQALFAATNALFSHPSTRYYTAWTRAVLPTVHLPASLSTKSAFPEPVEKLLRWPRPDYTITRTAIPSPLWLRNSLSQKCRHPRPYYCPPPRTQHILIRKFHALRHRSMPPQLLSCASPPKHATSAV